MTQTYKTIVLLIITLFSLLLFDLGVMPVSKIQEVRIAETAREMLVSGDYLVPRYNGELRLQKPPLPYWATLTSYKVFGVNEFAVRFPAVMFGLFTNLLMFLFVKKEASLNSARNAFLILGTTFISIRYFRSGEADAMLLFFISMACIISYWLITQNDQAQSIAKPKYRQYLKCLLGVSIGLAFLSKGPAGIAIPLLSLIIFAWQQKKLPQLKQCFSIYGLIAFVVIAGAWYGWIFWKLPDVVQQFMGKQLDETFISGTHRQPFYWYFAHFFEFFMPWGFLLPLAIVSAKQRLADQSLPPYLQFSWIWLIVVLVLLTFTINKQMQYALLFLPPLTIILADYTSLNFNEKNVNLAKINLWFYRLVLLVLSALMIYFLIKKFEIAGLWLIALVGFLGASFYGLNLHKTSVETPIFFIATGMLALSVYMEQFVSNEPHKFTVQKVLTELNMAQFNSNAEVYQAMPDNGAYSFYAKKIISPIKEGHLTELVKQKGEIFWITKSLKPDASIQYRLIKKIDDTSLYVLSVVDSDKMH